MIKIPFELLSFSSCACFFATALYVSIIEHPARLELDTLNCLRQWKPSYQKAKNLQIIYLVLCFVSALLTKEIDWILPALVLFFNLPFTLIALIPINNYLLKVSDKEYDESDRNFKLDIQAKLIKWGKLHTIRTFVSGIAFIMFLYGFNKKLEYK
jgi:hypothetical protein